MRSRLRWIHTCLLLVLLVLMWLPGGHAEGTPLININTASDQELRALPGIGPVLAKRIVEYRSTNGDFKTLEAIMNVKGIGKGKFEAIKDRITIGSAPVPLNSGSIQSTDTMVNINCADVAQLTKLPEVGRTLAQRIVDHRIKHGLYKTVDDLARVPGIGQKRLQNIKLHITVILDINRANSRQLRAYGFENSDEIMAYRAQYGGFKKLDELLTLPSADGSHYHNIKSLLTLTP